MLETNSPLNQVLDAGLKHLLIELLARGEVQVIFNPQGIGVEIPPALYGQETVTLNFSYGYHTDLTLDNTGIRQELSFQGSWFPCVIPWGAVIAARCLAAPLPQPRKGLKVVK